MIRLPRFENVEPRSVEEACSLLSKHNGQAKVLAGGTDLLVLMKNKLTTSKHLVNIKRIQDLVYIREDNDGLRIGALTTLRSIETSPVVQGRFPILCQAAGAVATRQIQNTATIGGNLCLDSKCWYYNQSYTWRKSREACYKRGGDLCHVVKGGKRCYAVLSGDTVPALLVLQAKVRIASVEGQREIPVEEFFTGIGETPHILKPGELVTEIQVPYLPAGARGAFIKHSIRGAIDFALADAAAVVTMENSRCKDARIVIGSIGPAIVRATKAEEVLKGNELGDKVFEEVGEVAAKDVRLVSGAYCSVYYRRQVIKVLAKRVVRQAVEGN